MKPTFALTLSHDSIGLLHRTPSGWLSIGTVRFDDPELTTALDALREAALGLEPGGIATKLVIPNSEILYDTIRAPGPKPAQRRAQIAAAIEGRTPYALDELVFDWSGTGDTVQVAVVARETLAEAEAFAVEHGFNPVSFVAIPEPGGFAAEPWFGLTEGAGDILGGAKLVRDQDPMRLIAPAVKAEAPAKEAADPVETAPVVETAPQTDEAAAEAQPEDIAPVDPPEAEAAPTPEAEAEAAIPEPEAPEAEPQPTVAAGPSPEPEAEPAPEAPTPEPAPETEAKPQEATIEPAPVPEAKPQAAAEPAPDPAPEPEPAPEPAAAPEAEPERFDTIPAAFWNQADTLRQSTLAAIEASEPVAPPAPQEPSQPEDPDQTLAWPGTEDDALDASKAALAASLAPVPDPAQAALVAGLRREPAPNAAPPVAAKRTPPAAKSTGPALSEKVQKALGKASRSAKKNKKPAERPAFAPPPPPLPASSATPKLPNPATEAEAMTLFGKRNAPVGGKPRYLGIALTAGLLLLLLLVAVWAAMFLEPDTGAEGPRAPAATGQADLTPPSAEERDIATLGPDTGEPDLILDPGEPIAGEVTEPPADAGADIAEAIPEAAPAGAASGREAGTEARALDHTPVEELTLPLPDPALGAAPQAQLAGVSSSNPDLPPGASPVLPEFGALYQFDADGNIRPTPEGVITPDGVRLVAGRPAIIPPPRPTGNDAAPTAPETAAEPAEDADTPVAEAPAPAVAADPGPASVVILPATGEAPAQSDSASFAPDSSVPANRPRTRPEGLAPAAPAAGPTVTEEGALPGTPEPAPAAAPEAEGIPSTLANRRPPSRPASIAAQAEAEQTRRLAEAAAAAASAASTAAAAQAQNAALTLAPTRRPSARPANFARQVETAVAAAAAQPRAAVATAPSRAAPEDDGEPEVTRAAPNIPTRASVARQATVSGALNLGRVNLIGVFGTNNNRHALVRENGGRLVRVKVGDRLDGGRVIAIGQSNLIYQKGRNNVQLDMPRS